MHFLLANHDLAQIQGEGIMKAGTSVCEAFTAGVKRDFDDRGDAVSIAIGEFLLSLPLAVRAPNGSFSATASQPTARSRITISRSLSGRSPAGLPPPDGPVYQLIWGRNMQPRHAADFASKVNANILVTGHQPQDTGYFVNGDRHLITRLRTQPGVFLSQSISEIRHDDRCFGR